eukprot:11837362-Alexandrium_andersonii.AAC.1
MNPATPAGVVQYYCWAVRSVGRGCARGGGWRGVAWSELVDSVGCCAAAGAVGVVGRGGSAVG